MLTRSRFPPIWSDVPVLELSGNLNTPSKADQKADRFSLKMFTEEFVTDIYVYRSSLVFRFGAGIARW